jgi:hypothetical protein
MNELSSVLRDVLRALGVEEWERAGFASADLPPDCGDLHQAGRRDELVRG